MIRHQFGQVEFASEQWFRLAAATIAAATHAAGLATPAKPRSCRLRHVDLVATASQTASLVLVLAEGSVKQELIPLVEPYDQHELDDIARLLNAELGGCSARQVANRLAQLAANLDVPPLMLRICQRIERMMREFDCGRGRGRLQRRPAQRHGGAGVQPEREAAPRLRRAAEPRLPGLARAPRWPASQDVQVLIGTENEAAEMQDVSLVLATYGQPGRAMGVVGVLGPTRMAYPQAIGTVRFVSGLMNELVEQLYR